MLHEGGFRIVKEADDTLRFITADGRTIPPHGYRLEDFVDDDIGGDVDPEGPSQEGFCTTRVQRPSAEGYRQVDTDRVGDEVRESAVVYRIGRP